jgi:hypothetical protein
VGDIPWIEVVPETGIQTRYSNLHGADHSGVIGKAEVSGLKNGLFRATLLLPVSGHVTHDDAVKWMSTDTYTLKLVRSNGQTEILTQDSKSLYYVTFHEVEFKMSPGEKVRLEYHRGGSGGPGGYPEGRLFDVIWDGK